MPDTNIFGGKRILLAEDDYFLVMDLVQELSSNGADLIGPVPTLGKAIERLENVSGIEGAILDINLQGELVFPLADKLQERGVPFVFASGYDQAIIPERYARVPKVSKPVSAEQVADLLFSPASSQHGEQKRAAE